MEDFKEKIPMIIAVIIVIALVAGAYYFLVIHKDLYYTKIDNTKIEEISTTDDMKYEYTLTAYNKNGKSWESNNPYDLVKELADLSKYFEKEPKDEKI